MIDGITAETLARDTLGTVRLAAISIAPTGNADQRIIGVDTEGVIATASVIAILITHRTRAIDALTQPRHLAMVINDAVNAPVAIRLRFTELALITTGVARGIADLTLLRYALGRATTTIGVIPAPDATISSLLHHTDGDHHIAARLVNGITHGTVLVNALRLRWVTTIPVLRAFDTRPLVAHLVTDGRITRAPLVAAELAHFALIG